MTAKIHIERMMHRSSIAVMGESASSYALLKLIPTGLGDGASKPMGLNLALALDVSRLHVRRGRHRHQPSQTHSGRRHQPP